MSLVTQLTTAFTRVGTEFKTVRATLGVNTNLTTSAKDTLVNAINEVNAKTSSAGAQIDDTTARTTTVYSSSKTNSAIAAAVNSAVTGLLNGAPTAYDTLKEIADYIASDTSGAASMTASINNKVDFAAAQTLTTAQQNQALANINGISVTNVGDVTRDFSGDFTSALA